ncbi:hypothetical protein [Lysobacter fragariae]
MKLPYLAALALGLALPFGVYADDSSGVVDKIAAEAGVTPREVQMVYGARTAFAEYRTSFDRVEKRVYLATQRLAARETRPEQREAYLAFAASMRP